jgi:hypothetical protein
VKPIRIGCSGWNYQHWRNGVFYPPRLPPRRWLDYYARHFDTVEVNSTFYRLPRENAVANWVSETPPDFLFAVKMSRYVTHIKRLRDLSPASSSSTPHPPAGRVASRARVAAPPGRRDDERLAGRSSSRCGPPLLQFRHETRSPSRCTTPLRRHGVALGRRDTPERPFQTHELTADWTLSASTTGAAGGKHPSESCEWARGSLMPRTRGLRVLQQRLNGFARGTRALQKLPSEPPAAFAAARPGT